MSIESLMEVFIIHLPTHIERRQQMESQMKRIGITTYRFVTPVVINDIDVSDKINRPSRSLYETNIALMEMAMGQHQTTASPYVLILEDDIVPTVSPEKVIPTIEKTLRNLKTIPTEWDMLYLEYCWETCLFQKTVVPGLIQSRNPLCTAAILYRRDKFPKILSLIAPHRKEKQIDKVYKQLIYEKKLNAYSVYPALFRQDTQQFQSSLDTFYTKRFLFGYSSCDTVMWAKIGMVIITLLIISILIRMRIAKNT